MSKRYKITRSLRENDTENQTISLEEAKQYFQGQSDFTYTSLFTATAKGQATVSIEGDFFMWNGGGKQIPFRHFQGDIYVSGTDDAVIPRMQEIARDLDADIVEG